jgi:hypothetical protein
LGNRRIGEGCYSKTVSERSGGGFGQETAVEQQELSVRQFGTSAANYLTSPVHSTGADLERLSDVARQQQPARVLDLGCIDVIAPETPLFDTTLQVIEFLRDASHVRDYRVSEWSAMQRAAGFVESTVTRWAQICRS